MDATRVSPSGELILADGLRCRPLIGKPMVPLNWRVRKTLRKGHLPIVRFDFVANEAVRYTFEAFAYPLDLPGRTGVDRPAQADSLTLLRATLTNIKQTPSEAHLGMVWHRKEQELRHEIRKGPSADALSVFSDGALLVYQFIGRDEGEVHPGEGFYDQLYLRDGAYQAASLAHAGYLDAARESLEHFLPYQSPHGQFLSQKDELDANGYALWAFVEYYRLSGDIDWLRRVYPLMKKSVSWIRRTRRTEKDPESPFFGLLPASFADGERLHDGEHHIVGYDWWNLRGVQSAAEAARALGRDEDAAAFAQEFEAYGRDILRALERTRLPYIPPSYEKEGTHWGNLEVIFPSPLIEPHDPRLTATLEYVRNQFGAADGHNGGFIEGTIQWNPPDSRAIHPYMSQFVTNSHIIRGDYEEAIDGFYSFLLHTTSTHGFPEGVYYKRRLAWHNTVPHLWAAALYVTTPRNMLVREQGQTLHLLSCVPAHWLDPGKQIRVDGAPTHFGKAGFTAAAEPDLIRMELNPPDRSPAQRIIIHLPQGIQLQAATVQNKPFPLDSPREVILEGQLSREPCTPVMRIQRAAEPFPITFASRVAAYKVEAARRVAPQ